MQTSDRKIITDFLYSVLGALDQVRIGEDMAVRIIADAWQGHTSAQLVPAVDQHGNPTGYSTYQHNA